MKKLILLILLGIMCTGCVVVARPHPMHPMRPVMLVPMRPPPPHVIMVR